MNLINQGALATAVVNVVGNTQGLEKAIAESRRQMHGFMVFAQGVGGKTGGFLSNMLAAGGAKPILSSVLGQAAGGRVFGALQRLGVAANPVEDINDAMEKARRQFARDFLRHRMLGTGIKVGNVFNGQLLQNQSDVATARIKHNLATPKLNDYLNKAASGVAAQAQQLAMTFAKIGLAAKVFQKLAESGAELDRQFRKASNVFGRNLSAAGLGYGGIGSNMSRSQYLAGAAGIGQEFAANGVGTSRSASMTSALAGGAGRLAQMWGGEFEDVAGKISQAIGGSNNALQQFGIVLTDDLVRANAFNKGMIKLHETMSDSIAAQSRYDLILKQINDATKDMSSGFFNLDHQWQVFTSSMSTALQGLGTIASGTTAAVLGLANSIIQLGSYASNGVSGSIGARYQNINKTGEFLKALGVNLPTSGGASGDRQALLEQAGQDAKRADEILRRERSRQSSNVGYHSPEDFYQHIQKGIFGDPVEFAKRQADITRELLIVSKEQLAALRDLGYKVANAAPLLQP